MCSSNQLFILSGEVEQLHLVALVTRLTKLGPVQVFYTSATGLDILKPGCTAGSSGRLVRDRFLELVPQGGLGSQNLGLSVPRDSSSRTGICDHCSRPHFSLEMVC